MIPTPILFACTCMLLSAAAIAVENVVVNDAHAADALIGEHRLSLQWISWQNFGEVRVENDAGILRLRGRQLEPDAASTAADYLTIEGKVTRIDTLAFVFQGEIAVRLSHANEGRPCVRQGVFHFDYREDRSRSWRLRERESSCHGHTDYIDIYIDALWRPELPERSEPTRAELWGKGIVFPQDMDVQAIPPGRVLFPDQPISLFHAPEGGLAGRALRHSNGWQLQVRTSNDAAIDVDRRDLREVGYESRALVVHQTREGWVKVLPFTLEGGAWINARELLSQGFRSFTWIEYLLRKREGGLVPVDGLSLNLRAAPSPSAERIAALSGGLVDITPTGRRQGAWLEVRVERLAEHFCTRGEELVEQEFTGWLKAVDASGFPNLWYPTRGC